MSTRGCRRYQRMDAGVIDVVGVGVIDVVGIVDVDVVGIVDVDVVDVSAGVAVCANIS